MANDTDKIKQQKQALLAELESIKGLLNDETANAIPVLRDAIVEEEADAISNSDSTDAQVDDNTEKPNIEKPNQPGVLPGQQSLFEEGKKTTAQPVKAASAVTSTQERTPSQDKSSLANNPFLPPHVRQRLDQEATQTKNKADSESPISPSYTERLVEQLIAHHIPKIEAELRNRLEAIVEEHNERIKK